MFIQLKYLVNEPHLSKLMRLEGGLRETVFNYHTRNAFPKTSTKYCSRSVRRMKRTFRQLVQMGEKVVLDQVPGLGFAAEALKADPTLSGQQKALKREEASELVPLRSGEGADQLVAGEHPGLVQRHPTALPGSLQFKT